jgi:hypothetical protein
MKHLLLVFTVLIVIGCKSKQIVTIQDDLNLPTQGIFKNIKIDEGNAFSTGICEPSIAINPKNNQNIVAGSVLDNVYYTFDSGESWTKLHLKSEMGVYGDPCIVADNEGNFYYLHLANPEGKAYVSSKFLNQMVIHKSTDGGISWDTGTGIGKNEPKQQDKEWAAIHPETGQIYVSWTEFDKYGSSKPEHKSRIRFSTSKDGAKTFSEAISISDIEGNALDDDATTEGAVPAVDRYGNVYVAWSVYNKIYFDKSTDGGKSWNEDQVIAEQHNGWTQDIPGIGRCNGMPVTMVDNSNSPNKGTIYINWTDQRNGNDNTDVFIIKSKDQGKTWSKVTKVNQDNTQTHQFFTWMSVDPVTGYIYIIYYDRSKYTDSQTDVVLSISKDGGETFTSKTISESPFTPITTIFFGDYNNISAYNGLVYPIWTRYENGKLSVWTALIDLKK